MGTGTDVAMESAEITLVSGDLSDLRRIVDRIFQLCLVNEKCIAGDRVHSCVRKPSRRGSSWLVDS